MQGSRQRYGLLLFALGVTFFFYGVAEPGDLQRAIGTALCGVTLLLALNAGEVRVGLRRLAALVVILIVASVIVASVVGTSATAEATTGVMNALLVALAPYAVAVGVYRTVRTTGTVTVTVVAGVLCLYMLVGLFFAFVYVAMQNLGGAPFFANGSGAVSSRAVYFSFITLTTVGYGDYTARTNFGHTLSITEALIGQIYLVTVVSTIVSRLVPRSAHASS